MRAAGVGVSTASFLEAGPGASPRAALRAIQVRPIPILVAMKLLIRNHYLHSLPGGTSIAFGVFLGRRLLGAVTLGVGPTMAYKLVDRARPEDCLTLTRLWLSDELPANSESRVLGVVLRALKKHTALKFLISYADPSQGHLGVIYQATGWLYTGLSQAQPLYDIGDGIARYSRSLSHAYGTHSVRHFAQHGVVIQLVPQSPKHRYLYFLDPAWWGRLVVPVLAYPRKVVGNGSN